MTSALLTPTALDALISGKVPPKIIDATYGVPGYPGSVIAHMENFRIPGAQFFDIDAVADSAAPYPHTLPDADTFAAHVSDLGISNDDTVVVYDQNGISFAAARVWWMFRTFGHDNVFVLNGGYPAWRISGLPLESGPVVKPAKGTFTARYRPELFKSFEDMEDGRAGTVLDARAAPRFEARAHTLDGDAVPAHIPGSFNVPFQDLIDYTGALLPAEKLAVHFEPYKNVQALTCTCGSGVTACVVALALYELGRDDVAIFDGSWTEWSDRQNLRA